FDGENLVGVLYMVVHEQPTPLKQLAPEVPDYVIAAIGRAMSKRKEDRFPRMADFVRAIMSPGNVGPMKLTGGLQMGSAVFRMPSGTDLPPVASSSAEAVTAVPHLVAGAAPAPQLTAPLPSPPPFAGAAPVPHGAVAVPK